MKRVYFFILIPFLILIIAIFIFFAIKLSYQSYFEKQLNSELYHLSYCLTVNDCETENTSVNMLNVDKPSLFKNYGASDYNTCNFNIYKNKEYNLDNIYKILHDYSKRSFFISKVTYIITHPFKKPYILRIDDFPIKRCDENKNPQLDCVNYRCVNKDANTI